jgi:hypothetical protein
MTLLTALIIATRDVRPQGIATWNGKFLGCVCFGRTSSRQHAAHLRLGGSGHGGDGTTGRGHQSVGRERVRGGHGFDSSGFGEGHEMKVAELLDRPEKWCQGAPARDANGWRTSALGDEACSWCLMGALHRCYPIPYKRDVAEQSLRSVIECRSGRQSIVGWQDEKRRTFAEVRAAILEAGV